MRFGVLRFPGSCDEVDALQACGRVADARIVWHGDTDLDWIDAVVVPGGFSYGDYLRVGSIARFAPAMEKVMEFAADGGPVLGICNGFQVLCEAGLLPGALLPNEGLRFLCRQVDVEVWPTCIVLPKGYRLALSVRGTDYVFPGEPGAGVETLGKVWTGVGPFTHDDPRDRPPAVFGGDVTLHAGPGRQAYVLLPIIPKK